MKEELPYWKPVAENSIFDNCKVIKAYFCKIIAEIKQLSRKKKVKVVFWKPVSSVNIFV